MNVRADPPETRFATKVITSSVVRGAQLGQSHGGLCIVDVTGQISCAVDWNTTQIDVEGSFRTV